MKFKKTFHVTLSWVLSGTMFAGPYTPPEERLVQDERKVAYDVRVLSAHHQTLDRENVNVAKQINDDEENVRDFAGSFHKLLDHNLTTGALTGRGKKNFQRLVKAMKTGKQADFNAIKRTRGVQRIFINPQASFAFTLEGSDTSLFHMPEPPSITSSEAAAELLEVYWFTLCRDVAFEDYGTGERTDDDGLGGSITANAAAVLNDLGTDYKGPRNAEGFVDETVLFRGTAQGDLVGPYLSQFLLQPVYPLFPSGCAPFVAGLIGVGNLNTDVMAIPQYVPIPQKREFGVSWDDFVAIQNGHIPREYQISDYNQTGVHYPTNGRDMGSIVHTDSPYQAYYQALNVIAYRDFPRASVFPYQNGSIINEGDGHNMGVPDAYALVGVACLEAFKAAWAQKWRAFRRLRPEAMAGLVHQARVSGVNTYNLHPSLFSVHADIDTLQLIFERNQKQALPEYDPDQNLTLAEASTYLLAQMYPEGSPAHPAYPSGHATVAGACTTVIKAIFEDTTRLHRFFEPVKVDPADPTQLLPLTNEEGKRKLTLGGELDKLASNIALARNFGGVHYRADGDEGILLGEEVAIRILQDHARTYPEEGFIGFEFTKRNGHRIRVTADAVVVV